MGSGVSASADRPYIRIMADDLTMRIVYLIILLLCLGGSFWASMRQDLAKSAQQALIWVMIFVGMLGAVGLYNDLASNNLPRQSVSESGDEIVVPRYRDGHYHLTLNINGADVDFLVDTGATDVVLTQADARKVGLNLNALDYSQQASTANGIVQIAPVRLDRVTLGDIVDTDFPASVNGGQMDGSLLGMAYLERFRSIEIKDNALVLKR